MAAVEGSVSEKGFDERVVEEPVEDMAAWVGLGFFLWGEEEENSGGTGCGGYGGRKAVGEVEENLPEHVIVV